MVFLSHLGPRLGKNENKIRQELTTIKDLQSCPVGVDRDFACFSKMPLSHCWRSAYARPLDDAQPAESNMLTGGEEVGEISPEREVPGPETVTVVTLPTPGWQTPLASDGQREDAPLRAQHLGRIPAVFGVTLMIFTGSACSTPSEPSEDSFPAAGDTAGLAAGPQAEAAKKSALAAYAGYLAASREAERSADPLHPELRKFLADPLLTRVRLAIRDAKEHGAMRTGTLISDPTVTGVSLDTVPATVTIQDCLDTTGYRLVYTRTRKTVPGSTSGRYVATATATRYRDGQWLISASSVHRDQPC